MRPAPLLLAALVIAPGAWSAATPPAALLPRGGSADACADSLLVVDECGDTMEGDLNFTAGDGLGFPAGRLLGDAADGLTFSGIAVCLANATTSGCSGGDITAVTAGTGLSGGGLTGAVTLTVDFAATQQRVTGSCVAGAYVRVVNQDGSVACGTDANSGGTVTSVASGAGLTGGPITTNGTLGIATGGVTSAMVADGTLVAADVNAGSIQRRVSGSCVAGAYVRVVNQDGSVACGTDANSGGTVTSVASGAGLTGGPITTNGTLGIATGGVTGAMIANGTITWADVEAASVQLRVQGLCGVGTYIRIIDDAGEVTCGSDANSGGTVTQVNAGAGLTGGPITTNGTIGIASGGVTTTMIADGTITAADLATGSVTSVKLLDGAVATADLANGAVTGAKTDASQVQARVTGACAGGSAIQTITQAGAVTCGSFPGDHWRLGGNAGTKASDFVGTTDNTSLEVRVNGTRALRIEPERSPNLVGGWVNNTVDVGVVGAVIAGGGEKEPYTNLEHPNRVISDFGTIGGGVGNLVGLGIDNPNGRYSTIAGGKENVANGSSAAVAGGSWNTASGASSFVVGELNQALGHQSTVPGGTNNLARGGASIAAGGSQNEAAGGYSGTFAGRYLSAAGLYSVAIGGSGLWAVGNYSGAFAGAGSDAEGPYSVVLGGESGNASGEAAAVVGGRDNRAAGDASFAAGSRAHAEHYGTFVWGDAVTDWQGFKSTAPNQFLVHASNGVGINTNAPTGTISMGGDAVRSIKMERRTGNFGGLPLTLEAGGAPSGSTNQNGGALLLQSGIATGTGSSNIAFATAAPGASGTGDRFTTTRMTLTGAGDLGIGTTVPPDKLTVRGDVRVGNSGTNGCVKRFDGTALTGVCSSDARLKKDVAPFEPVLDRLVMLQPSTYAWRADEFPSHAFGTERTYGLIAQEVQAVFPEMVGADAHGFLAVDYSRLPLLLLQAVKDLEQRNDALEGENHALRAQLDGVAERLERLERSRAP